MRRRDFLRVSLLSSGALWIGVGCTSTQVRRMRDSAERGAFQPTHFLTIEPDGRVQVGTGKAEMGQGVFELYRLLVAEELGVAPDKVTVANAIAGPEWAMMGLQITGGSTSSAEAWKPLREGAAAAREMLRQAAAAQWKVSPADVTMGDGIATHQGKRLGFGALAAVAAQQEILEAAPRDKDYTLLGQRYVRPDILPKVTGAPVYGMDVQLPGMVKAVVIRPPVFGGTPQSTKADTARSQPGVVDVFEFELGVAVVAEKYWQARRAADLVEVTWDPGRNADLDSAKLMAATIEQSIEPGETQEDRGDVDDALDLAGDGIIDAVYSGPYLAHACMEPMNATVHVEADRVRVWAGTQFQSGVIGTLADLCDVPRDKVIVHTTLMGGGFGRRSCLDFVLEAALISKRVGKPAQVVWSREDDTRGGYYRPLMVARIRGALGADGRPTALYAHGLSQNLLKFESWAPTMAPAWMPSTMIGRAAGQLFSSQSVPNPVALEGLVHTSYDIPNVRVDYTNIQVAVPVSFWRSVGHTVNAFAMESFIDELAHAAGKDPVEYRRALIKNPRRLAVLEAAVKASDWGQPIEAGWGRGVAATKAFNSYSAMVVEAGVVDGEIHVRKVSAAIDCGTPINPDMIETQIQSGAVYGLSAALWQKIDLVDGRPQQGNFHDFPALRMHQCPAFTVTIIDSTEAPTGVGELGTPPAAPALANAIFAATGKRLRSMPFVDALEAS